MGSAIGKYACAKAQELYGNGKIALCHVPPGNLGNAHTISISPNALGAHLAHGDSIGACEGDTAPPDGYDDKQRKRNRLGVHPGLGEAPRGSLGGRIQLKRKLESR
jgi:hypothetical protein